MRVLTASEIEFVAGGDNSLYPPDYMQSSGYGTTIFTSSPSGAPSGTSGGQNAKPPSAPSEGGGGGAGVGWMGKLSKLIDDIAKSMHTTINVQISPTKSQSYVCTDGHGNAIRDAHGNPVMCSATQGNGFSASVDGVLLVE